MPKRMSNLYSFKKLKKEYFEQPINEIKEILLKSQSSSGEFSPAMSNSKSKENDQDKVKPKLVNLKIEKSKTPTLKKR